MFLAPPRHTSAASAIPADPGGTLFSIGAVLIMLVISYLALVHPGGLPVFTVGPQQL